MKTHTHIIHTHTYAHTSMQTYTYIHPHIHTHTYINTSLTVGVSAMKVYHNGRHVVNDGDAETILHSYYFHIIFFQQYFG